jgi:hypothetical protein
MERTKKGGELHGRKKEKDNKKESNKKERTKIDSLNLQYFLVL